MPAAGGADCSGWQNMMAGIWSLRSFMLRAMGAQLSCNASLPTKKEAAPLQSDKF